MDTVTVSDCQFQENGGQAWHILTYAPYIDHHNWDCAIESYFRKVLSSTKNWIVQHFFVLSAIEWLVVENARSLNMASQSCASTSCHQSHWWSRFHVIIIADISWACYSRGRIWGDHGELVICQARHSQGSKWVNIVSIKYYWSPEKFFVQHTHPQHNPPTHPFVS